jgi:hypothetical protein
MSAAGPLQGAKAPWGAESHTQWASVGGSRMSAAGPLQGAKAPWGAESHTQWANVGATE